MAEFPSCPIRLIEARTALHNLQLGQQAVETWTRSGIRTRYTQVNIAELRAYVRELESECGGANGGPLAAESRRRPIGVQW